MKKNILNTLEDEKLMLKLINGDHQAFSTLYLRHKGRLMAYLINKTNSVSLAEELLQITFEKIYTKAHLFNKNYKFLPWFFTIAHNTFLDSVRKNKKILTCPSEQIDHTNHIYKTHFEIDLNFLSNIQKKALELKFWSEHNYKTIAKKLKISEPNARKIISRALKKLRLHLNTKEIK